jgi:outer membrane receptor for ferrienterochelin and colicin
MSKRLGRSSCASWTLVFMLWGLGPVSAQQGPPETREPRQAIEAVNLEALLQQPLEAATKTSIVQLEAPQAVTVLTRHEIDRIPARSLAELLRSVVGANVVRVQSAQNVLGARGSNAFSPSKILILIDGQPIDPTLFSTTWWELVPVSIEDIERIEFIRSPGTIYGANAQNGVVNIITRRISASAADRHQGMVRAASGQQRLREGYGGYFGSSGRSSFRLSAELSQLHAYQNDEVLQIVPGRPSKPGEQVFADDKNMIDVQTFSGALRTELGTGRIDASLGLKRISKAQGRVPDRLCFVGLDGSVGFFNARYTFEAGGLKHGLQAGQSRINYTFLRNDDSLQLANAEMTLSNTRVGYEIERPGEHHSLLLGLAYGRETAEDGAAARFLTEQTVEGEGTFSAHIQDEWKITENDHFYLGGLLSHHYVSGTRFAPFAAYVRKLGDDHALRAGTFTSYRNPGVFEHSLDYDQVTGAGSKRTRLVSNRDLGAERTVSFELGYRGHPAARWVVSVDTYLARVDDAIEWTLLGRETVPVARPRYQSQNTLEQTVRGAELDLRFKLDRRWTLSVNLAATDVSNESSRPEYGGSGGDGPQGVGEGRYGASYVPPIVVNAILDFERHPLRGYLNYQYTDAHTWQWPTWNASTGRDSLDLKPVPSYSIVNFHLGLSLGSHLELAVEGYNVFNELHTEWRGDESYFGRTLWAGITGRF